MFFWINVSQTIIPCGGAGQKPPKRGYKLGKVVVCPQCHHMAPYDPAMAGQQVHCPECDLRFYLGNNVKDAWLPPLAKCRKCGTLNGKSVKVCPVCGAKNRHLSGCAILLYAALAFFALCVLFGLGRAIIEDILGK